MAFRTGTLSLPSDEADCLRQSSNCDKVLKQNCHQHYVHAPIDKFGVIGRWFRHTLLEGILVGTPVLLTIQKHRTPNRTVLMKTLSFLGTEDFYTLLFLCLMWLFDPRLGRLFGILMWVGFYTTGFLKTFLCLPRPPCPPVVPLEKAFDWALPSHHSLLGVTMPWYIWLYATLHYDFSTFEMGLVCTLIVLWSFGVLLSRLYLGVHSPADIVCGGIVGVLVLSMWMQVDDWVDFYISQQSLESQLKLISFALIFLFIHPTTEPGNPSLPDTCVLYGVGCGIILARSQRSKLLGMSALMELYPNLSVISFLKLSILRIIIGGIIITVLRICLKHLFLFVVHHLYRFIGLPCFNSSVYRKSMPPNPKHYTKDFKIPPIYRKTKLNEDEGSDSSSVHSCTSNRSDDNAGEMISKNETIDDEIVGPKWFSFMQIFSTVHSLTSKSKEPWDVTPPVKMIVYCMITFVAVEIVPQVFSFLGV